MKHFFIINFPDISNEGTALAYVLLFVPSSNRTVESIVTDLAGGDGLVVVLGAAVEVAGVVLLSPLDTQILSTELNCKCVGICCPQLCELYQSVLCTVALTGVKIPNMFLIIRQ